VAETSYKFIRFVAALEQLCRDHEVTLSTSEYDYLQVWDGSPEAIRGGIESIEDRTKPL
jgi:hypothetical protein